MNNYLDYGSKPKGWFSMAERKNYLLKILGGILCLMGFHDFRVISATLGFSVGDTVEKVECKRCNYRTTRHGK